MKKIYERPEVEIKEFLLTDCILTSIESSVTSEIHEATEPDGLDNL